MAQKASPKKIAKKGSHKKSAPASAARAARKPEPAKAKSPAKKVAAKPAPAKSAPAKSAPSAAKALANGKGSPAAKPPVKAAKPATVPVVAPPANAKEPRKQKVPSLSKSDLQYFRNLLLERRREIIGDMGSMESEAFKGGSNLSNMPIHMADVGTDNFEQEFTLGLIESERQMLRDIQEALIRIDDGTYGICQGTNQPIPRVRLEAVPWAKYTKEYQLMLEQGKVARDTGSSAEEESGGDDDED